MYRKGDARGGHRQQSRSHDGHFPQGQFDSDRTCKTGHLLEHDDQQHHARYPTQVNEISPAQLAPVTVARQDRGEHETSNDCHHPAAKRYADEIMKRELDFSRIEACPIDRGNA